MQEKVESEDRGCKFWTSEWELETINNSQVAQSATYGRYLREVSTGGIYGRYLREESTGDIYGRYLREATMGQVAIKTFKMSKLICTDI